MHPSDTMSAFPMYDGMSSMPMPPEASTRILSETAFTASLISRELRSAVVRHDYVGSHLRRGHSILDAGDLDLHLGGERCLPDLLHGRPDAPAGGDVIVLDHDHGVQAGSVGVPSGDPDGLLLEVAESGGGLAGGCHDDPPVRLLHRLRGEIGHAAHPHQDVQRGALGGDDGAEGPGYGEHPGPGLHPIAVRCKGGYVEPYGFQEVGDGLHTGDDGVLLAGDVRGAVDTRDQELRGGVSASDVGLEESLGVHAIRCPVRTLRPSSGAGRCSR